jgi:LPS export ABC transporter protein LptC
VAQQYQGEDLLVVEKVKVTLYARDGRTFMISGNQARVHQSSKDMELSGDVQLTSSDGYQLKTQNLTYNHAEKKVTTSDPVEIDGELFRLVGRGMLVDFGERRFRVLHQVRTQLKGGLRG